MIAFGRKGAARKAAAILYTASVAAARDPAFYRDLAVADTVEGRFEMISLHVALLIGRVGAEGQAGAVLSQAILDYMAADLDRSMREAGVGDLSVGRYMKRLGEGFYGRAAAYEDALHGAPRREALSAALLRNIYDGIAPGGGVLERLAIYAESQAGHLKAQPYASIALGTVDFLPPQGGPT